MDEYSFISENGTVRQIRDLVAKAKDEEQDGRLATLETAVGVYPSAPTTPKVVWESLANHGNIDHSETIQEKGYYIIRANAYSESASHSYSIYLNGVVVQMANSYQPASGVGGGLCLPLNTGDVVRITVNKGGSGTYDTSNAGIYFL